MLIIAWVMAMSDRFGQGLRRWRYADSGFYFEDRRRLRAHYYTGIVFERRAKATRRGAVGSESTAYEFFLQGDGLVRTR